MQKLLTISEVAAISKRSADSVRRDADSGALPAVHVGATRAFEPPPAVLYAVRHRVGVDLAGFDCASASKLATAIAKMDRRALVGAYPAIDLFCTFADDAGRSEVAAAIAKFTVAFEPFAKRA